MRDVLTQMRHFEKVFKDGRITFFTNNPYYHDETETGSLRRVYCQKSEDPRNIHNDDEEDEFTNLTDL